MGDNFIHIDIFHAKRREQSRDIGNRKQGATNDAQPIATRLQHAIGCTERNFFVLKRLRCNRHACRTFNHAAAFEEPILAKTVDPAMRRIVVGVAHLAEPGNGFTQDIPQSS